MLKSLHIYSYTDSDLPESTTSTTADGVGDVWLSRQAKIRKLFSQIHLIEHPKAYSQNVEGSLNRMETIVTKKPTHSLPLDTILAENEFMPKAKALAKTLTLSEAIHKLKPVFDRMPLNKLKLLKDLSYPGKEEEFEGVFGELCNESDDVTATVLFEILRNHVGFVSEMLKGAILKKGGGTVWTNSRISASREKVSCRSDEIIPYTQLKLLT